MFPFEGNQRITGKKKKESAEMVHDDQSIRCHKKYAV